MVIWTDAAITTTDTTRTHAPHPDCECEEQKCETCKELGHHD